MPILQYVNELRPLEIVDNIVDRWRTTVVPFYVKDTHSTHRAQGCGSGFVVERHRATFLVTALHVLKDIKDGEALVANIGGQSVLVNGLRFATSPEDDLAIAYIDPQWAKSQGMTRTFSLSLDPPGASWTMLNIFVLLGYPGSQNKLNWSTGKIDRRLLGYSSSRRIEQPLSTTHIRNPVAFIFDKKTAVNTDEDRINVGLFRGNSGGPVLEIRGRQENHDTLNLSASLAGVFLGWDKHSKELVCCRPDAVASIIDNTLI